MDNCYRFEKTQYKDPIFKDIEATYIIYLEGNGRLPSIQNQLKKYHPTETVYIVHNKGFKKCQKNENIKVPAEDLLHAFHTIFKDANEKKYNNILILEDDFFFDEKILDKTHASSIEQFLKEKEGQQYIYFLGTLPFIQFSTFGKHNRVILSGGKHACIYPKKFINYIINNFPKNENNDWDIYTNFNFTQFKYYTQLCYQLTPKTENQSNWGISIFDKNIVVPIMMIIYNLILKLDIHIYPGYDILEFSSKFICWTIIVSSIIINIIINMFIWKNFKWLKKQWHYYIYFFIAINIAYPIFMFIIFITTLIVGRIYHIGFT